MTLGESIKAKREALGLTQQQLAEKLFVSRQTVSRWESGSRCPDLVMSKKISLVLGISLDDLISSEHLSEYEQSQGPVLDLRCIKVMLTGILLVLVATFLYCADDGNMEIAAICFICGIIIFIVGIFIPGNQRSTPVINDDLPQHKCPQCAMNYDFDYPQCPYCGHSTR